MQRNISKNSFEKKKIFFYIQIFKAQCREILILIENIQTTCLTNRKHLEQGKEQTKILKLFEPRFGPVYVKYSFFIF
jgi:hypothetical protein